MCANYLACDDDDSLEDEFGVRAGPDDAGGEGSGIESDAGGLAADSGGGGGGGPDMELGAALGQRKDAWPTDGGQPYIRLSEVGKLMVEKGHFGLLPHFAKEKSYGRKTYNARCETIDVLASFKDSWDKARRCIIPADCTYEPKYDLLGKNERWRINRPDGKPMGIAGLYRTWRDPMGKLHNSFTMITVNADRHPLMSQFHKPGEEKRMVVILTKEEYDAWLTCSNDEAKGFFKMYTGNLEASPAPLPPRKKKELGEAKPKAPRAKKQPPGPPAVEHPGLF
jgi:putative SOS response-associated peptidase YedK